MALGGCSAVPGPQLADHAYLSIAATENGAPKPLVGGTRIRLDFEAGSLSANAGCNTMGASYRVDGGRLVLGDGMGMTAMGCDPALQAQDEWLSGVLTSTPTVRLAGNTLTLEGPTAAIQLVDRAVAEPDRNLVGTTWTVESVITGDAVGSVPAGAVATLLFNADGTLQVSPGCNHGGGAWKLDGAGIRLSDLVTTKMACAGPRGELETAVLRVLSAGLLSASIDSNLLTLQGAGGGLQLRAG